MKNYHVVYSFLAWIGMLFIVAFFFAVCIIVCPTIPTIVGRIVTPIVVVGILVIGLFNMGSILVKDIDYELD